MYLVCTSFVQFQQMSFIWFSVAVFVSWARQCAGKDEGMSPTVMGCIAGSVLLRKAASLAFESCRRSTLTTDIIQHLGKR